jgi:hypothetical protein
MRTVVMILAMARQRKAKNEIAQFTKLTRRDPWRKKATVEKMMAMPAKPIPRQYNMKVASTAVLSAFIPS